MFISAKLLLRLDPRAQHTLRVLQANALIDAALSAPLASWLEALDDRLKELAFDLLVSRPRDFLQLLWNLAQIDAAHLPPTDQVLRCAQVLLLAYRGSSPDDDLAETPGEFSRVGLPGNFMLLTHALDSSSAVYRNHAQDFIRGKDDVYLPKQGLVYAPFIMANRQALRNLVTKANACEAIFSLERGGSLVADHLAMLLRDHRPNVKVKKLGPGENKYKKDDHIRRFQQAIRNHMRGRVGRVRIGVTESIVGGGSANRVLDAIDGLMTEFPQLRVRMLFERHTVHQDGDRLPPFSMMLAHKGLDSVQLFKDRPESIKLSSVKSLKRTYVGGQGLVSPTRVKLFIASARYILGEDVDYQMAYEGEDAGKPLVIFNRVRGELRALKLTPTGGHTAREMLVRLVLGAYDDVLREYDLL